MKFDIETVKRKMLIKYPFFGSILANVKYAENNKLSTAGTDGHIIYYNTEFMEKLNINEQTFVLAHEVCHIAFNHILRSDGKNSTIWNIATDAVINAFLKKDGLSVVEGVVEMDDAINYNAEQLYEKLLNEMKQQQQNAQGNEEQEKGNQNGEQEQNENNTLQGNSPQSQSYDSKNTDGSSSGEDSKQKSSQNVENSSSDKKSQRDQTNDEKQDTGHDTHSMWEEAVRKHKEEQTKKDQKESSNKNNEKKQDKENKKSEIQKKQEEIEKLGEKEVFSKNSEEKKKELEKLKQDLIEKSLKAGNSTNESIREINNVGKAKPLLDWRYVLRETLTYDVDWSYKNATIEYGVVTANLEELPMPETEIVLDTSGSINETLLKNFLKECKNILKYSKLKVGCFDTKFYGFTSIRFEEDIDKMIFQGGGGTDFNAAVNAFSLRVDNKIIFTDGEARMPNKALDAIWIVFGDRKIQPNGGKVIQISDEQYDKLISLDKVKVYK